jgi:hypothetical protein
MSEAVAPAPAPARFSAGRTIRWLLALQIGIAVLLMGGDFSRLLPRLLEGRTTTPPADVPVHPGDQTRRYAPDRLLSPAAPGFPDTAVPKRLAWENVVIDDAPALRLTGKIAPGDAERFAAYLDGLAAPPATVALHSPGGSVDDALTIGRRLRADGVATRMQPDAACLSACPYILAGGVERTVSRSALVGVHQHYFGENTVLPAFLAVEDIQRGQAAVMAYLDEMGIDPLLSARAMQTPPQDVYILVEDELEGFALATAIVD